MVRKERPAGMVLVSAMGADEIRGDADKAEKALRQMRWRMTIRRPAGKNDEAGVADEKGGMENA